MKVLLCSPLRGKIGGISLWTKHIVNYFKNSNTDLEVTLVDAGRRYDIYPNTPLYERIAKGIREYAVILKNVRRNLTTEKFDILHLVSSASISLVKDYLILSWAKKTNTATAIHFHFGRIPQIFEDKKWELFLLKKVISKADRVIVIDPVSYGTLQNEGYKNVFFLANPLSPDVVKIISEQKDTARIPHKIMFAGHVIPSKGIHELVEACKDLEGIEVHIIGAVTDEMKAIIANLAGNSSDKFFVLGEKNHETIIKEMLSSRIFVLPSYTEGFPNVILESMATGCSIISTPVGAIPEMLAIGSDHPCGVTVEPKSAGAVLLAISELLKNSVLADEIAGNAVQKVNKDYNIETVTKKLNHIWKDTIKANYENQR